MPKTPVLTVGSANFQFKFLTIETPLNLLPNFAIDPIEIPLLTTCMLGATTISTPMVVIPALND